MNGVVRGRMKKHTKTLNEKTPTARRKKKLAVPITTSINHAKG